MRTPYKGGCDYPCEFHFGKTEWHHPVSLRPDVGIYLCEAHHSILQGRKFQYSAEKTVIKTLIDMKREIMGLVFDHLEKAGLSKWDIDKN